MMRSRVPFTLASLNALKSFEAAARTSSYMSAAVVTGVSAAAVSQKVRHLESYPGKVLFSRFNNRSAQTDADQAVFAGTTHAIDDISTITAD
jgi:LysR family glycine cleavage system transcriptional activator